MNRKIYKIIILVFAILSLNNIILLIRNYSYAYFEKNIKTGVKLKITTLDEMPNQGGIATDIVKDTLGTVGGIIGVKEDNTPTTNKNDKVREYRYSGASVNNYIYFNCEAGTTYVKASTNCEMWRIIGVFKDENGKEHLKIVKNEVLNVIVPASYIINGIDYLVGIGQPSATVWNFGDGANNNDWATAGLQYFLNTETDETTNSSNKGYLSYIKGDSLKMIEDTKYYLGTITAGNNFTANDDISNIIDTPINAYVNERLVNGCTIGKGPDKNNSSSAVIGNSDCRVWANNAATWTGKIALMYPSDYGFSVSSEFWNTKFENYNANIKSTSWLNSANHSLDKWEWLLSPSSYDTESVVQWTTSAFLRMGGINGFNYARPCLNLKSQIIISKGKGTSESPYFIEF